MLAKDHQQTMDFSEKQINALNMMMIVNIFFIIFTALSLYIREVVSEVVTFTLEQNPLKWSLFCCVHHFPLPRHQASHDPFTKQDQPLHHTIGNDSLCFCACPWLLPHHHLLPYRCQHLHYFCTFCYSYNIPP